jgi:polysaccharide biosynthesis/export protein
MKKYSRNHLHAGLIIMLAAILLSSCVPQKKIRYFQDLSKADTTKVMFGNERNELYKVQPGDNLYIRITSIDNTSYSFEENRGTTNYYTEAGIYLNSYYVDNDGNIEFPLIGKINVQNQGVDSIRAILQRKVDEYVKNTSVIVKLANFRVTLLGEVKNPGKYLIYQDKITIFEAIGMAGDLTDFAKRNNVLLMREVEDGFRSYRLNLNDRNIVESDFYYLLPNDMIYVEPIRGKQFSFAAFPYALIFTTITTTLLLINFFKTN